MVAHWNGAQNHAESWSSPQVLLKGTVNRKRVMETSILVGSFRLDEDEELTRGLHIGS